uniref:Uncharacterized protein n=1 Tax=Arundo donax TaxID=35708 RepID=A0A0A9FZV1_ARUDO
MATATAAWPWWLVPIAFFICSPSKQCFSR